MTLPLGTVKAWMKILCVYTKTRKCCEREHKAVHEGKKIRQSKCNVCLLAITTRGSKGNAPQHSACKCAQTSHFILPKMSKTSPKRKGGRGNMSQCEWTHCCFSLIRRDKWGVNRFPSLGPLKSPLESMGHTPVRLSVYQPASLLPL